MLQSEHCMLVENYFSDRSFSTGSPRTTAGPQILGRSLSLSVSHYVYKPIVTAINIVILHLATFFISVFNVYVVCFILPPSLWQC